MAAGLLTAILVALQGILSGTEVAVTALGDDPRSLSTRPATAHALRALRDHLAAFVATVQIGVTGLIAATGVVGGAWLAPAAVNQIAQLTGTIPGPWVEGLALVLVTAGLWLLCVVFGDLLPISLAMADGERFVAWFGRPVWWLARRLQPLTRLVASSSDRLGRGLALAPEATLPTPPNPAILRRLIEEAQADGVVHPRAAEIASRALGFGELTVADVMVPRNRVRAIEASASPEHLRQVLLEEAHACMPVYAGTLDQVVGVLVARDVLALAWERHLVVLDDLLQPPFFAPKVMRAVDLLKELQSRRMHFAVVVEELGGTAGIVTIKDLLEELVGEIFSDADQQQLLSIRAEAEGTALVPGMMPLREVNRELDSDLQDGEAYTTLGGLCVHLAGRIPEVGATLDAGSQLRLEVVDASPRRVRLVRVRRLGPAGALLATAKAGGMEERRPAPAATTCRFF